MRTNTLPTRTPLSEKYYHALGTYLTAEANLREIRTEIHRDTLSYYPDGFTGECEEEEEAYLRILSQVEANYPLARAVYALEEAEKELVEAFLDFMEEQATRRESISIRNLRHGLHFPSIRQKVVGLAQKYCF